MKMSETKIILASASPRRRELLKQIGLTFEVRVSSVEEKAASTLPGRAVEEIALQKAEAVLETLRKETENVLVIGADTVVSVEGRILGKPSDVKDAVRMLKRLSGRTHEVYTGVALLYRDRDASVGAVAGEKGTVLRKKVFYERTRVTFYPLTEWEIVSYANGGDCLDKAGAYGIQGEFARYVKGIEGDYNNVVGLPAGRVYQEAKEWLGG